MPNYHQPLLPNETYHLFSRAVGNETLFRSEENYLFFLRKLKQHFCPIADLFCYSLMPNHFHLLARIHVEKTIIPYFEETKKVVFDPYKHNLPDFIMERFSNFLNSYAKSYNKVFNRRGALFMDYVRRSKVNKEGDFTSYVFYIHKNAVHHGLCKNIGD